MELIILVTVLTIIYFSVLYYFMKKSREATEKELDKESLLAKAYKESSPKVNVHTTSKNVMRTPTINVDDYKKKRSVVSSSSTRTSKPARKVTHIDRLSGNTYISETSYFDAEDFSSPSHSSNSHSDGFGGGGSFGGGGASGSWDSGSSDSGSSDSGGGDD